MAKSRSQRTPEDRAPLCHICVPPRHHFGMDHKFTKEKSSGRKK